MMTMKMPTLMSKMISPVLVITPLQYQKCHSYCERRLGKPEKAQKGKTDGTTTLKSDLEIPQQLAITLWILTASARA